MHAQDYLSNGVILFTFFWQAFLGGATVKCKPWGLHSTQREPMRMSPAGMSFVIASDGSRGLKNVVLHHRSPLLVVSRNLV